MRYYYRGDIGKCIVHLFPEVGLKKVDFGTGMTEKRRSEGEKRRRRTTEKLSGK